MRSISHGGRPTEEDAPCVAYVAHPFNPTAHPTNPAGSHASAWLERGALMVVATIYRPAPGVLSGPPRLLRATRTYRISDSVAVWSWRTARLPPTPIQVFIAIHVDGRSNHSHPGAPRPEAPGPLGPPRGGPCASQRPNIGHFGQNLDVEDSG